MLLAAGATYDNSIITSINADDVPQWEHSPTSNSSGSTNKDEVVALTPKQEDSDITSQSLVISSSAINARIKARKQKFEDNKKK